VQLPKVEKTNKKKVSNIIMTNEKIKEVNVYGIPIKGYEGKACMAAICLKEEEGEFDFKEFYKFIQNNLTTYSSPIFIRIKKEMDNTGTFKNKKMDLVNENFDIDVIKNDNVYFKNDLEKSYIKLDSDLLNKIKNNLIKF
jgi:acyl-CoA synthetase (AMP-forming)/AMP-acid ligase II